MPLKNMNSELKKVISRVKSAQSQLQSMIQDRTWVDEARKYAERQGEEVKKLINSDVKKLKGFLEREKKELEKLQSQLPGEVVKLKSFVADQKKEFRSLLSTVTSAVKNGGAPKRTKKKKSAGSRKAASSKKTSGGKSSAGTKSTLARKSPKSASSSS